MRLAGRRHLDETSLLECYVSERAGEGLARRVASHLAVCDECTARYRTFSDLLDADRVDAESEIDAVFPADRLQAQRQHIMMRLEHIGQAARVISFPVRAARRVTRPSDRALPRWAAAAAAGIFLGMGLHIAYEGTWAKQRQVESSPAVLLAPPPAPVVPEPSVPAMDPDTFFSTLDAALGGPRDPELMPLDALTPLAREISMQVR